MLAFQTWDQLAQSRACGHQLLEETLTDLLCLHLKSRHANEVFTRTFTKPEEGKVGADWEWWFTGARRKSWLGFRVQAKVLELRTLRYRHLHYYRKPRGYQSNRLIRHARAVGAIPLYCLYSQWGGAPSPSWHCGSFGPCLESYGCSLLPISAVLRLRKANKTDNLAAILPDAIPWHCLVCCEGYGTGDLPARAWAFATARGLTRANESAQMKEEPPSYVEALLRNELFEAPDEDLRAVTVFQEGGTV